MSSIINEGEDKLDLDTGYFTRESFLVDSPACEKFEEVSTQFIREKKIIKKGRVWYLTSITLPGGVLYPDSDGEDGIKWVVAPVVGVDDPNQHPIPGQTDKYYETRVGIEDAKKFSKFKEGLVYLGML
jgi:hypothetical protein